MKRFVEGTDRGRSALFPECLEDWIFQDNPVRAIDVFVDELDLAELGFSGVEAEVTGRPRILHDEITTIDNALTRPWTVDKKYVHNPNLRADWPEFYTTENNAQIKIGNENYFLSWDGLLMPAKKDQAPPDLRYFKPAQK